MPPVRARVLRVLSLVAFVAGFLILAAHMLLQPLLLETQLTYAIYGMAGVGILGALVALADARGAPNGTPGIARTALIAALLNGALIAGTVVSTTTLVALPPVSFAMDVGDTLPEFEVEPRNPEGKAVRLADLRGRPVVILFHRGGWCPFCQAELAGLNDAYDEIEPLATVLAISVDVPDAVRAYARARDLRFTLLHDADAHVAQQYGLTFESPRHGTVPVPAAIILDTDGRIAWFHVARTVRDRADPDELLRVLRTL